jgi:hypothetical protein
MAEQLLQYIGQLVLYGGGAVGLAYGVFHLFGVKWLENKFAERLATFKHAQAKEIEELRFHINSVFDRLTKLHQREFEILPEAWAKLYDAHRQASSLLAFVVSRPDLDRMSEAHRNEYLQSCDLMEWQKEEIRQASDKNKCYENHIKWSELAEAKNASVVCHAYLHTNGIFLEQEMKDSFTELDNLIWKAIFEREMVLKHGPGEPREPRPISFKDKSTPLMEALEVKVRRRLHIDALPSSREETNETST